MSKSAETPRRKYLQQLKPSALRKIAESCTHISSEDVEAAEDSHCPKESMIRLLLRSEDGAPSLEWQSDAPEPEIAAVQPAAASQPPNPFRARGVKSGSTLVIEAFAAAKAELQKCLTDEQTTVVQVSSSAKDQRLSGHAARKISMDILAHVTAEQELRMRLARDKAIGQMHLPEDVAQAVRLGSEVQLCRALMDAAMTEQQRQTISVAQSAAAQAADQAQAAKLISAAQAEVDRQLNNSQRARVSAFKQAMLALQALR